MRNEIALLSRALANVRCQPMLRIPSGSPESLIYRFFRCREISTKSNRSKSRGRRIAVLMEIQSSGDCRSLWTHRIWRITQQRDSSSSWCESKNRIMRLLCSSLIFPVNPYLDVMYVFPSLVEASPVLSFSVLLHGYSLSLSHTHTHLIFLLLQQNPSLDISSEEDETVSTSQHDTEYAKKLRELEEEVR